MSWDFTADDLRKQITDLNTKLAVQGIKLGEQETKSVNAEKELESLRDSYDEAMRRLREEADRALQLEQSLLKHQEDLTNEKLARENVEKALRTSENERKKEGSSLKETQYLMDRLANDSNESASQVERYAKQTAKLEAQVRELQGELSRKQTLPVPQTKTPSRRRSSSLSNGNKLAFLERDLESIKESASSSQLEAEAAKDKLAKAMNDLLSVENKKSAVEKKVRDLEALLQASNEDKEELMREIEFHRGQDSASRERDLMDRLEHEEQKVALLESELTQMSRTRGMKSSADRLSAQLRSEIEKREAAELREVQLTEEREEALSQLHELQTSLGALQSQMLSKDAQMSDLQRNVMQKPAGMVPQTASSPLRIDEQKVDELLGAIGRLREERDELKSHLEFSQMEAHFEIEALRKQLTQTPSHSQVTSAQSYLAQSPTSPMTQMAHIKNLNRALSAFMVTVQCFDGKNTDLMNKLEEATRLESHLRATASEEISTLQARLAEQEEERFRLSMELANVEEQSHQGVANLHHELASMRQALSSKDEELVDANFRFRDASDCLCQEKDRCETLEEQLRDLEVDCNTIKQELADAMDNCARLEARQASSMSSDAVTKSLRAEVEELKARVLRRTEQIGLQQHDIKRLETNLRLTEETLEETRNELDIARTENEAMLDDCSTSRSDREEAQKALVAAELEVERLSALLSEQSEEIDALKDAFVSLDEEKQKDGSTQLEQVASLTAALDERKRNEAGLTEKLTAAREALVVVQNQVTSLTCELSVAKDISQKLASESKSRSANEDAENSIRDEEVFKLRNDVAASRELSEDLRTSLKVVEDQYAAAAKEVEYLQSELHTASQARAESETVMALDLERLRVDLEQARNALAQAEGRLETSRSELELRAQELRGARDDAHCVQSEKEKALQLTMEVEQLTTKLAAANAEREELQSVLGLKEQALSDIHSKLSSLESEKAQLTSRVAAFEIDASRDNTDLASLRSALAEEQHHHKRAILDLEAQARHLEGQVTIATTQSDSAINALESTKGTILAELEETKKSIEEQRAAYDSLASEHASLSELRNAELNELRRETLGLRVEIEELTCKLNSQAVAHAKELEQQEASLKSVEKAEGSSNAETLELLSKIKQYEDQVDRVRTELVSLQDDNTAMQSEIDQLCGERQRGDLQLRSVEHQLELRDRNIAELREEITRIRDALSHSERTGKGAEMNLLLMGQQHERTVSSLRAQLREHEKDSERIQKLQQIVGEMREQISELDACLREKNAEIEENDDKFIQLLKEKKKLTSKVETLTKRNNNLQSKLVSAQSEPVSELAAASSSTAVARQPLEEKRTRRPSTGLLSESKSSSSSSTLQAEASSSKPRLSSQPSLPTAITVDPSRRLSNKRLRMAPQNLEDIPVQTYIGKKRSLPDDMDNEPGLVEARFPDSAPMKQTTPPPARERDDFGPAMTVFADSSSLTPRHRRPLQASRTGFTPMRGQTPLRSGEALLAQPSPIRKSSATRDLFAPVISDVTNSPPKARRAVNRPKQASSRGWLDKLQSKGMSTIARSRTRSDDASRS